MPRLLFFFISKRLAWYTFSKKKIEIAIQCIEERSYLREEEYYVLHPALINEIWWNQTRRRNRQSRDDFYRPRARTALHQINREAAPHEGFFVCESTGPRRAPIRHFLTDWSIGSPGCVLTCSVTRRMPRRFSIPFCPSLSSYIILFLFLSSARPALHLDR